MKQNLHAFIITLVMCVLGVGGASAQTTYTVQLDNGVTQSETDWFTVTDSKSLSWNARYTGTYGGHTYKKGLKIQGGTSISFKTAAASKVTIVQSLGGGTSSANKYANADVKFDGTNLGTTNRVDDNTNGVGVYTISNVALGEHKISRGTGETGILFVQVDEEAATTTQLATPTITFDASNGQVTIGSVENADGVYYTIDGTEPSAENGTKYTAPFTVGDGTNVKAIAVGDESKYRASEIASATVLLDNVTIAAPTFKAYNGTVLLATETANATIEYSLDGTTYQTYTKPFTLTEDATVYARASRAGKTSETSSQKITTIAKPEGTTTYTLSGEDMVSVDGTATTNGSATFSGEEGFKLEITSVLNKSYSKQGTLTINGKETAAIKLSNGAQNTLTLPEGKVAKRLVIYSSINSGDVCGWKEVAGVSYENGDGDYKAIPMGSNGQTSTDPDVRVYPIDNASSITFTSAGQLFFVLAIDVADAPAKSDVTINITDGYATLYYSDRALTVPGGATANTYKLTEATSGAKLSLSKSYTAGSIIPAGTAVLVNAANGEYTFTVGTTDETADAENALKGTDEDAQTEGGQVYYMFSGGSNGLGFYWGAANGAAFTNKAHKAYVAYTTSEAAGAKSFLAFDFGSTTGINSVKAEEGSQQNSVLYNLSGQRVDKSFKGIVVKDGHKFFNK